MFEARLNRVFAKLEVYKNAADKTFVREKLQPAIDAEIKNLRVKISSRVKDVYWKDGTATISFETSDAKRVAERRKEGSKRVQVMPMTAIRVLLSEDAARSIKKRARIVVDAMIMERRSEGYGDITTEVLGNVSGTTAREKVWKVRYFGGAGVTLYSDDYRVSVNGKRLEPAYSKKSGRMSRGD